MIVLVCGGRDYRDKRKVWTVLHELHARCPISHVIQGGATGADVFAKDWAISTNNVQDVECKANWDRYGKAAGALRNAAMLRLEPHLVIAFPGGRGTADMVRKAQKANVLVRVIIDELVAK